MNHSTDQQEKEPDHDTQQQTPIDNLISNLTPNIRRDAGLNSFDRLDLHKQKTGIAIPQQTEIGFHHDDFSLDALTDNQMCFKESESNIERSLLSETDKSSFIYKTQDACPRIEGSFLSTESFEKKYKTAPDHSAQIGKLIKNNPRKTISGASSSHFDSKLFRPTSKESTELVNKHQKLIPRNTSTKQGVSFPNENGVKKSPLKTTSTFEKKWDSRLIQIEKLQTHSNSSLRDYELKDEFKKKSKPGILASHVHEQSLSFLQQRKTLHPCARFPASLPHDKTAFPRKPLAPAINPSRSAAKLAPNASVLIATCNVPKSNSNLSNTSTFCTTGNWRSSFIQKSSTYSQILQVDSSRRPLASDSRDRVVILIKNPSTEDIIAVLDNILK